MNVNPDNNLRRYVFRDILGKNLEPGNLKEETQPQTNLAIN